jgi:hypothetical protein
MGIINPASLKPHPLKNYLGKKKGKKNKKP